MGRVIPMIGRRFDRLLVLAGPTPKAGKTGWLCQCSCGKQVVADGVKLRNGRTRSCGCYHIEVSTAICLARSTHGHWKDGKSSPTYRSWESMMARCYRPKNVNYGCYGGRGITVCEQWHTFENFLADMGERPADHTLDKIDNDKNYAPGNCRWATPKQQSANRRRDKILKLTAADAVRINELAKQGWNQSRIATEFGVHHSTINSLLCGRSKVERDV